MLRHPSGSRWIHYVILLLRVSDSLARKALAECIGTGLLVAAVIGSGIAAAHLSPGDVGLQLLENAMATTGALVATILAVGSVSGAHLNPVVTLADRFYGGVTTKAAGVWTASLRRGHCDVRVAARHLRDGPQWTENGGAVCRRSLHRWCVLLHQLYEFR